MNDDKKLIFSVYSRPECHLCDDMLKMLEEWQKSFSFDVKVFNINEDPDLTARYAARIPLLTFNDIEICEYHFDETSFLQFFKNLE